ncbi:MAG: DNA-binding protein [Candidatus Micrarchaeota archaeon]
MDANSDESEQTTERIRKKKLNEIQQRRKAEAEIKTMLRAILDSDAYDRMTNVNIANPELYAKAVQGCVSVYQKLGRKLGTKEVLFILKRIKSEQEEPSITFERK